MSGAGDEGVGQPDAALLAPLSEDTFLHNLHVRYKRDIIYTYVGNALVSVNPCRALPLYSAELVRAYLARPPYQLPPHLYGVAASAYRCVRDRGDLGAQCIVITGESGAGKTEAARVCLQCAVLAGGGAAAGGGGAQAALTAAGTLLEAFGNAATIRNHNASRFGKLLEIEFDFKGEPVGGHITHYLLEKSRAAGAAEGERNFHVLYQLLAGADVSLLKRLKLQRSWEQYRILRGEGGASPRRAPAPRAPPAARAADQHDVDHFAFTKAAMGAVGLSSAESGAVLRLLAFTLKLGNVTFEPQHNVDGSIGTRIHHKHELVEACALVGVEAGALGAALTASAHPPHLPGEGDAEEEEEGDGEGEEGDEEAGEGGAEWARAALQRLLATLYSRLFTWLVRRANEALSAGPRAAPPPPAPRTLAVLDVYGFERLARNSLERLLINYAAERVQACVAGCVLRREQEEYAREGLAWRALPLPSHEAHADLLDAGPGSLLAALQPGPAAPRSAAALLRRLPRHPRLAPHPPHAFTVVHFAGAVTYSARGMVSKNRDALCRRCGGALAAAREPLLAELFSGAEEGAGASPRRAPSLSGRQRALLGALVRRLAGGAPPRLVHCVRADAALRPARWEGALVRAQLRAQATLELARLRRAGWAESQCARAALAHYAPLARPPPPPARDALDAAPRLRALLRALPIPAAEFAVGRTRLFIRSPRTVWELEALRAARVSALVSGVQRAWRRHAARRRAAAAGVVARAWRRHRARARHSGAAAAAARRLWRWWCRARRRAYLRGLWARLPARHRSPACAAWPPAPAPRLLARTDALLRRLHHAWRCREYRARFDQTARNRMREKVTCSVLFRGRKALYAASVAHPFVGDYVRLRASGAWVRGARAEDRYVVFADACGKVARSSGRVRRVLCVLSTAALLLLEARSLRVRRRVPARDVWRLSLSPHADDVLVVHVRPGGGAGAGGAGAGSGEEAGEVGSCDGEAGAPGCLFAAGAGARRGDLVVRACHVLELATKLFLVVQNAVGAPPQVHVASQFEANFGGQVVSVEFHALGAGGARLLRRHDRMDVLL